MASCLQVYNLVEGYHISMLAHCFLNLCHCNIAIVTDRERQKALKMGEKRIDKRKELVLGKQRENNKELKVSLGHKPATKPAWAA